MKWTGLPAAHMKSRSAWMPTLWSHPFNCRMYSSLHSFRKGRSCSRQNDHPPGSLPAMAMGCVCAIAQYTCLPILIMSAAQRQAASKRLCRTSGSGWLYGLAR